MSRIYLIRHASPRVQPGVPASQWPLSAAGVGEARALAQLAVPWKLEAIYSSVEPKAQTTASIIAEPLGLAVRVAEGFEEQHWDAWVENADAFNDTVRAMLERAEERVGGAEAAGAAAARFGAALQFVTTGPTPAAVVSHGRVLIAWLAAAGVVPEPFDAWRALPMPAYACVEVEQSGRARLIEPFLGLPRADR